MAAASAICPYDEWVYGKPLQALNISCLRDYLYNEFKCLQSALPFGFDFERIIDDFVFLCFFVGKLKKKNQKLKIKNKKLKIKNQKSKN